MLLLKLNGMLTNFTPLAFLLQKKLIFVNLICYKLIPLLHLIILHLMLNICNLSCLICMTTKVVEELPERTTWLAKNCFK